MPRVHFKLAFYLLSQQLFDVVVIVLNMTEPRTESQSTLEDALLKELLQSVASLLKEVTVLKEAGQGDRMAATSRSYPLKRGCDDDKSTEDDTVAGRDGNQDLNYGDSHAKEEDTGGEDYTSFDSYQLSEEGEAFLETVFTSKMKY